MSRNSVRRFGSLGEEIWICCAIKHSLNALRRRHPVHGRSVSTRASPELRVPTQRPQSFIKGRTLRTYISSTENRASPYLDNIRSSETLHKLEDNTQKIMTTSSIPDEGSTMAILDACRSYARYLIESSKPREKAEKKESSPASTLLSLDEQDSQADRRPVPTLSDTTSIKDKARDADTLSTLTYKVVIHPNVFITPKILDVYIETQSILGRPQTMPEILQLYASKPVPQQDTSSIKYTAPNPKKASSAVPLATANKALAAAIQAKSLALCLDIIDETVCTTAYHRSKFLKRALLPVTSLGLAPLAIYALASQLSIYQDTMDSAMATNIAFAGISSYVGFTVVIGLVAVTTANDQMDRVTWATGLPLRERWMREEERAAIDRVAGAWGFKESWRRGEEEGPEWDTLREWTGLRGMVLDRVELMEGME